MIQKTILSLLLATLPTTGIYAEDHGQPSGMNHPAAPAGPCDNVGPEASRLILEGSARDDAALAVATGRFAAEHTPLLATKGIDWEAAKAIPGNPDTWSNYVGFHLLSFGSALAGGTGLSAAALLADSATTPRAMQRANQNDLMGIPLLLASVGSGLAASGSSLSEPGRRREQEKRNLENAGRTLGEIYAGLFGWDKGRTEAFATKLNEAVVSAIRSAESVDKIESAVRAIDPLTLAEQVDPDNAKVFAELKRWRIVQRPPVFTPADRLKKLRETQRELTGVSRALGIETKAGTDCDRLREIFAKAEERLTALCEVNR